MWTWRRGSQILFAKTRKSEVPLVDLVEVLSKRPPHQVPGTAVFFTSDPESTPTALLHSLKHYKVLHENNVVLTIRTSDSPSVAPEDRVKIEKLNDLFSRLIISYGYMETPDVPKALGLARKLGWKFNIMTTSFFLSGAASGLQSTRACPSGRTSCSSAWRATPMTPAAISACRQTAWWKWAARLRCSATQSALIRPVGHLRGGAARSPRFTPRWTARASSGFF